MNARPSNRANGRSGFTLVELVTVILVMGIIAAVVAPQYANTIGRYRADAAAKRIAADLNLARKNAKSSSVVRTVTFNLGSNSYTLSGIKDRNHPSAAYVVNLSTTGSTVTLNSANFGGTAAVTFNIYGKPDNGGSIVVTSGGKQRTITVDAVTGRTTIN